MRLPPKPPWGRDLRKVVYLKGDPRSADGEWGNESKSGRKLTSSMLLGRSLLWALGVLWVLGDSIEVTSEIPNLGGGGGSFLHWRSADPEVLSPESWVAQVAHNWWEMLCALGLWTWHWPHLLAWPLWTSVPPLKTKDSSSLCRDFVKISNRMVNLLIVCPAC